MSVIFLSFSILALNDPPMLRGWGEPAALIKPACFQEIFWTKLQHHGRGLEHGLALIKLHLEFDSFNNFVVGGGDDGDWDDEAQHVDVGDVWEMPDWINILRCSPLDTTTEVSFIDELFQLSLVVALVTQSVSHVASLKRPWSESNSPEL